MAFERRSGRICAALVATAGLLLAAPLAWPVNTGVFELDGNVADDAASGEDWATSYIMNPALPLPAGSNILARTGITADPAPQSIFTGGGSKDDLDLNGALSGAGGWKWKDGSIPDKDNITNAYAVAYNVNGKLVIYAGADRFDNSGDAFMGFWFFQSSVSVNANGAFNGQHTVGDTLVLANFTNGGTTVNIEVLKWVGTGGNVNGTLQRIAGVAGGTPANCIAGQNQLFCGITNTSTVTPPWAYTSKSGSSSFATAEFFEIGINISDVFAAAGGTTPCFTGFMAETRSSSSVSATLKDFVLHSFPVCGVAVTKQCADPVLASNTTVGYTVRGKVQNTGFGTITGIQLTDAPRPLGTVNFFACNGSGLPDLTQPANGSSLAPQASVCYQSSFVTPVNGEDDVITVTANAGSSSVTATASADCPNLQLSPAIDVTKSCTTTLAVQGSLLAVKVLVSGSVCNTGDTELTNVQVTDTDIGGNLLGTAQTLTKPGTANACRNFTGEYFPSTAENRQQPQTSTLVPGLAKFSDTVTATGTAPFNATVQPDTATAECTLCPTCTPDACTGGSCPGNSATTSSLMRR